VRREVVYISFFPLFFAVLACMHALYLYAHLH
jgi:hypothetical protein